MAAVRGVVKTKPTLQLEQASPFVWQGTDKRGVKMKGSKRQKTPTCYVRNSAGRG